MKSLLYSLLALPSFALSQSKPFVPLEYEYPIAILSTPKTYVYRSAGSPELNYKDVARKDSAGAVTILWKDYGASPAIDSAIEVNDKMIDHYLILNGQRFKGVKTEDSTYSNGTRLGEKRQSECFVFNSSLEVCGVIRSHFLKDTMLTWNNKKVQTIVITSVAKAIFRNPNDTSQKQETEITTLYYFGKDVGLIRYTTTTEGKLQTWQLEQIKEQAL